METTLHRQLKERYAIGDAQLEVPLGDYRIDVVCGAQLVEIQHGGLSAIRDKIRRLLAGHDVLVVKPLVVQKQLVRIDRAGGRVLSRRRSPKQGTIWDLFHELVHFTNVFPHPRLTLDVPLIAIEEWRFPGHGRRRRWRRSDHEVEDQRLVAVSETLTLKTASDLTALLPVGLPRPFHTGQLAEQVGIPRWVAQRVAYCLKRTGGIREVGKAGNTRLYERIRVSTRRPERA